MTSYLGQDTFNLGFGLMRLPKNKDGSIDIPQVCQMADAFNGMGSSAVAGMTKDELSFLSGFDLSQMFTDEQLATAAATHTSGKAGSNFNSLLGATGQASSMAANLSAEQWAKASQETLQTLAKIDPELNDRMARSIAESGNGQLMSSISGEAQKAALKRVNDAKAEAQARAQAEKTKRELEARDSQQRFQQRMVRTMEQIKDNTQRPPETFSDGGGI